MFGFVRFVAKPFMRSSETTPSNIAGTPSSLEAIAKLTKLSAPWKRASLRSDHRAWQRGTSYDRYYAVAGGPSGRDCSAIAGYRKGTYFGLGYFRMFR
jgi:hypothetical protein